MFDDFLAALMRAMHVEPDLRSQPGVTVAGAESRAESHVTAGYLVGEHLVITCDPAAEEMLALATRGMDPTLAAWRHVAASADGELLGAGRMQLLENEPPPVPELPRGFSFQRLETARPADRQLVEGLAQVTDDDELDEADIELDALDEIVHAIVDADGAIAAYSASDPFDMTPDYGDIGILTRPDCRGLGLGSIAVAALCHRLRDDGLEPLYRCSEDNVGSIQLSAGLGFRIATQLVAYRFAPAA